MLLTCGKGHSWYYNGSSNRACCSVCRSSVTVRKEPKRSVSDESSAPGGGKSKEIPEIHARAVQQSQVPPVIIQQPAPKTKAQQYADYLETRIRIREAHARLNPPEDRLKSVLCGVDIEKYLKLIPTIGREAAWKLLMFELKTNKQFQSELRADIARLTEEIESIELWNQLNLAVVNVSYLRYRQGMTVQQISEKIGYKPGQVYFLLNLPKEFPDDNYDKMFHSLEELNEHCDRLDWLIEVREEFMKYLSAVPAA